ncbi:sensor histidine kinase [Lysobacter sp. TY2-98]|uniref:sensor histidine kinase n=1 Tax=Lysobacter sp. TY2-98 TaxID=2290922 RepID=UPI000E20521D|nr:HAMP domain-containing sensor histidine kinase [Lysobacter sp. TY2-98]AXK71097.1 sensor histidine kinase [Lysobacter sp. TY2-98]
MAHGLPRKIKVAFIVQALLASLVMALGIACAEIGVRQVLLHERLADEAANAWEQVAAGPRGSLPHNARMATYFVPAGRPATGVPADVLAAPPGYHIPYWGAPASLVEQRRDGTLYVYFDPEFSDSAIFWTGGLSLLLALLVTYVSAWLTYRTSKRMVAPVSWLAGVVARWEPSSPNAGALSPQNLPIDAGMEVRRLAHALRGMSGRVGEFVERERQFTRDASHELRTPLTVIRVASDIMAADSELPERSRRAVGRIQRAGQDMQTVIDAFFILARDAEVESESERFDVHEVVDDEVENARAQVGDKPVEVVVRDEGGGVIDAPRRVLSLMVGNLLSNAVRFTDAGLVEVVIRPDRIEVRDTGVGMTRETLTKAFDAFYRHDRDSADGMGIGLSIVRRLGERFGWPVELDSTPGEGTVATIRLRG